MNALEFNKIKEIYIKNGIIFQNIASYTHEQARSIERINLTLLNKIRSMLFTAKLQKEFWPLTLEATVYLYNRTPHTSLGFKTPFEVKYRVKPKINYIKIWNLITYSLLLNAKKLEPRAKALILINYSNNQYKLLDLKTKRKYWSRDVTIFEGVLLII